MKRLPPVLLVLAVGLLLLAWAPWLGPRTASARAEAAFIASWAGVIDGCGLDCRGCGVVEADRGPFGYTIRLEYACGLIPADTPEYHHRAKGFVSVFGTVHGLPAP